MINYLSASIVLFFEALHAPALVESYTEYAALFILIVASATGLFGILFYKPLFGFVAFLLVGISLGLWLPFNFTIVVISVIVLGLVLARACTLSPLLCTVGLSALMMWDILTVTVDGVLLFLGVELVFFILFFVFPKHGFIITASIWGAINATTSIKEVFNSYFLISELLIIAVVSIACIAIQLRISRNRPPIIGIWDKYLQKKKYAPKHKTEKKQ